MTRYMTAVMTTVKDIINEDEIEYDEHIWLSVKNAEKIVEELTNVLAGKDTKHAQAIRENASAYQSRLNELDTQYAQAVQSAKHDTVLFGDRFPFRYLVDDYGINYYAALRGCSSENFRKLKNGRFFYRGKNRRTGDCPKCW